MNNLKQAQLDSAIKKINERYIQICREFGPDSGIARDYKNTMELVAGSENLQIISSTTSKKAPKNNLDYITGEIKVAQIKRSKKVLEKLDPNDVEALLSKHTAGQIKKAALEEAKAQSEELGYNVRMSEVIDDMDSVYDFLDEHGYDSNDDNKETSKLFSTYWESVGPGAPRPSYTTLKKIIEAMDSGDERNVEEVKGYLKYRYNRPVAYTFFAGLM